MIFNRFFTIVLALTTLFLTASCADDPAGPGDGGGGNGDVPDIEISDDFNFGTLQDVDLNITVLDRNGQALRGVKVYTYNTAPDNELEEQQLFVSGITQDNGVFHYEFKVPSYLEELFIVVDRIGIVNHATVHISGNEVTHIFGGAPQQTPRLKKGERSVAGEDQSDQFYWEYIETDNNMSIVVRTATINGESLVAGDFVGVFTDDGLCAGYMEVEEDGLPEGVGVAAWGDDVTTPERDGFQNGETIHYRLWNTATNQEFDADPEYEEGNGLYVHNDLLIVRLEAGGDVGFLEYMGGFDEQGVPQYLDQRDDEYDPEFLTVLSDVLPERVDVRNNHPGYIAGNAEANITMSEMAEIFVSFIHDGALFRNAVGYYTYPSGSPPESAGDIESHIVAFPNASFRGDGGGLSTGNRVSLGEIPENTVVGWFLVSDGWVDQQYGVSEDREIYYSNSNLNPESAGNLKWHNVFGTIDGFEYNVLTFEDRNREDQSCDHDFNDVVFTVYSDPPNAFSSGYDPGLDEGVDSDGDGIKDNIDDYPEDDRRAFNNYFPSENTFGSIAFEDKWPSGEDYDFNDLVISYRFNQVTDVHNSVVEIIGSLDIKAVGTGFGNAFGFALPVPSNSVSSVSGFDIRGNLVTLSGNNCEVGQTNAVIIVTDDTRNIVSPPAGFSFINTERGSPLVNPDPLTVTVIFSQPIDPGALGSPPYNPFIIADQQRGKEIHLPGYAPTELIDVDLFGQNDDTSNPNTGRFFKTDRNLPWGLLLPGGWRHSVEAEQLLNAYPNFRAWAESDGVAHRDWYLDLPGNRNLEYIWEAGR